ncbi:LtrC-like protein [Dehalococcoides mccartyi VS]|uniref:LtrC-like protein n=2 Tax=Dehalococcoides mccartyi TaxID=61435 RepID=D2BGF3_DEHMV|nr:LtrC-like protein [Dehalococcoides mccartyi VS]
MMAGQATVTIGNRQWSTDLATAPWELTQGLGGIQEIPPDTGMLFDLGFEQTITVTTEPMLFPLDITFLSEDLVVTEIYHNVQPGHLVTSMSAARYFLEVNAGELDGLVSGSQALFQLIASESPVEAPDWVTPMISFLGFTLMGFFLVGIVRDFTGSMFVEPERKYLLSETKKGKCSFCQGSQEQCEVCEKVSPRDYNLLSWVGAPVPDYSFAVESETKERKIDEVLKKLKEGVDGIQQSDKFREFLLTMSKFHNYSIGNLILIMLQKPDATHVAGYSTWKDLYRWVKKGEKGIAILAPCMPPKQKKLESPADAEVEGEEGKPDEETEIRPVFFKVVHVFDVSQTEGKPLPEFEVPSLTGEANEELFSQVKRLVEAQGVEVSFISRLDQDPDIKGFYSGKLIWVRPEESRAQQLKTLLHEVAHYYSEGVFRIPRADAETIAESVAFTIGAHFGFDTGTRSFPYVALWAKDKKTLEANLAAIRKVSGKIIDGLEQSAVKMAGVV